MKKLLFLFAAALASCANTQDTSQNMLTTPGNPFLPLWEHIPDGEPYVFEDPDQDGKYRVYLYGSHDNLVTEYCGRDQVVWSAPVEDLTQWRYDGIIFSVNKNAKGELFTPDSIADVLFAPDVTLVTAPDGTKTYYLYPNDQSGGRNGLIAKSSRPDGPFEVCNWSQETLTRRTVSWGLILLCLLMTMGAFMVTGALIVRMLRSWILQQWLR